MFEKSKCKLISSCLANKIIIWQIMFPSFHYWSHFEPHPCLMKNVLLRWCSFIAQSSFNQCINFVSSYINTIQDTLYIIKKRGTVDIKAPSQLQQSQSEAQNRVTTPFILQHKKTNDRNSHLIFAYIKKARILTCTALRHQVVIKIF